MACLWTINHCLNHQYESSGFPVRVVFSYFPEPSAPPQDVAVEVMSTTTVLVQWLPPPEQHWNGQLTGYKLRYKPKQGYALVSLPLLPYPLFPPLSIPLPLSGLSSPLFPCLSLPCLSLSPLPLSLTHASLSPLFLPLSKPLPLSGIAPSFPSFSPLSIPLSGVSPLSLSFLLSPLSSVPLPSCPPPLWSIPFVTL